ncbi:MAG TPA: response regulator [Candidatus Saccharimonadales bacterium]
MKRILIIEDEKPLRDAFAYLLESEGFTVYLAENGRVGLKRLRQHKPDLILLDMLMPVMDGMSFLKEADLPGAYPQIKTLMLSNLSDAITFDDAHEYGVTSSVLKADLSPAQLVAVIKKVLSGDS